MMRITFIGAGHTIQIPAEWAAELGLEKFVVLEKAANGILVRPSCTATWDEIFADKLSMSQQPYALDLTEVSGDDLLL
ncbi:MAG: hypothetical protein HY731_10620 [Candidatus Tectomicrobia bacterium]|nr:hypothetical protein [Candidatus Tectomicrobia bacterium]